MAEIIRLYGHDLELESPHGLVLNVMVIARVKDPDDMTKSRLLISSDDGADLIIESGMLKGAGMIVEQAWWEGEEIDDGEE